VSLRRSSHHAASAPVLPGPGASVETLPGTVAPFPVVYRRYVPYVARIAHRLLGSDADLEDVLQEVFLIALERLPPLEEEGAVRAWLGAVTVRRVARLLRWRRVRLALRLDDVASDELAASELGPEQRSQIASAYRRLDLVPTKQRIAWILRHVEEEPLERVATMCGCSLATAKRWIAAAEAQMKDGHA
jgi:RNA polymerase sigma-70 factor, ECF subfamily